MTTWPRSSRGRAVSDGDARREQADVAPGPAPDVSRGAGATDGATPAADLASALRSFADEARAGGPVLVALDFDGVLAPLRDDPDESRALPEAVAALDRLGSADGVVLALVSGRAIDDLAVRAEVPDGTWLVGSHGAERGRWVSGRLERSDLALDAPTAALHAELTEVLVEAVAGSTARVEHKPASVVLHTRTAAPHDAERLTALALDLGGRPGVDAMRGKDVVELAVLHVSKGEALATLRGELGVGTVLYAGDDVTDERAFRTLRPADVTVKVGPGETAARLRVADPSAVAGALAHLADLLAPGA